MTAVDDFLGSAAAPQGAPQGSVDTFLSAPPQMQGPLRYPAMGGSYLAKGLLEGFALPGAIAHAYDKYIGEPFARWTTGQGGGAFGWLAGPEQTVELGRRLGIVDRPELQPQNFGERVLASGSEGVGAALPYGGAGGVPGVAKAAAQGAGAGVGGQVASDISQGSTNQYVKALAPTVGAVLGAGTGGAAYNTASRAVNAVTAPSDVLQAYKDAKVTPRLVGDVTGDPTLQKIQTTAADLPGGGRIVNAANKTLNEFGQSVEGAAQKLGDSATLQQAGENVQSYGKQWLSDFKNRSATAWGNVDMSFAPGERVPIPGYVNALSQVTQALPDAPATAAVLQPGLARELTNALQADIGTGSLQGAGLTWKSVKGIRSRIGDMLSDPNLPADIDTASLKRIYAGLSSDMENATLAKGPDIYGRFQDAAALTRSGHDFIDNTLRPLVREGVTPERAAAAALSQTSAGGTMLGALRSQMPDAVDELAAYKLRSMAQATPGQQGAAGATYSPGTFLTQWNKLSPESRDILYRASPSVARQVDALAEVSDKIKDTARDINTSRTGSYLAHKELMEMPKTIAEFGGGGYLMGGAPGAVTGALAGAVWPWVPGTTGALLTANKPLSYLLGSQPTRPLSAPYSFLGATAPQSERAIEGRQ